MNKRKVLFVVILFVCIAVLTSIGLLIALPFHAEDTKKIWLPPKYLIANKVTGFYVEISNTPKDRNNATSMDFLQLTNVYKSTVQNDTFDVYILRNSTVFYYWNHQGISFVSKNSYGWQNPAHDTAVTAMPDDNHVVIIYNTNFSGGAGLAFFVGFGIFCGTFFGYIAKKNI